MTDREPPVGGSAAAAVPRGPWSDAGTPPPVPDAASPGCAARAFSGALGPQAPLSDQRAA